jgi:hypothetical protein
MVAVTGCEAMTQLELEEVQGGDITITVPGTSYTVTYYKPNVHHDFGSAPAIAFSVNHTLRSKRGSSVGCGKNSEQKRSQ